MCRLLKIIPSLPRLFRWVLPSLYLCIESLRNIRRFIETEEEDGDRLWLHSR